MFAILLGMVLGALLGVTGMAFAQEFPNKAVRFVTSESGGGNDLLARLVAAGATSSMGQQIVVDNRVGIIAVETVAKAQPDGYTLLFYGPALWLLPFLRDRVSWDEVRDFSPVTLVATSPNIVVVHPSVPAQTVKELIALAKNKPGSLNYASGAAGSTAQLAAELFKSMAGINIVGIPYKGGGPALSALIAGEVQLNFATGAAVAPHVASGRLKALAVTSAQPSALAPGLPTVSASGLPGYESAVMYGAFAPAKTPAPVIRKLNQEIVRAVSGPAARDKFLNAGVEPLGTSPPQLAASIRTEKAKWGKLIKDAGIRAD